MKVYTTDRSNDRSEPERIKVGVADSAVAHAGSTLATSGLGSCIGIALADVEAGVGGLAHAMLPSASAEIKAGGVGDRTPSGVDDEASRGVDEGTPWGVDDEASGGIGEEVPKGVDGDTHPDVWKYVDTAVPALLRSLSEAGAERSRIEARIAGGSAMFEFESSAGRIGERNVDAVREALDTHGVPLAASDVGGDYGRSLGFDVATAELSIRRAHGDTHVI